MASGDAIPANRAGHLAWLQSALPTFAERLDSIRAVVLVAVGVQIPCERSGPPLARGLRDRGLILLCSVDPSRPRVGRTRERCGVASSAFAGPCRPRAAVANG